MSTICLISLLLLFLCFFIVESASTLKGKTGPYKITLQSFRKCPRHKIPLESDPSVQMYLEIFNDTNGVPLLRGNFSILKDTSKWKATAKQFVLVNGKWKSGLKLHSSGCQGIFITILVSMMGAKFDYDHCTIKLGDYTIKDLDVNKISHAWAPTLIYGKEMWRNEVVSPDGLVGCYEFYDFVEPL